MSTTRVIATRPGLSRSLAAEDMAATPAFSTMEHACMVSALDSLEALAWQKDPSRELAARRALAR